MRLSLWRQNFATSSTPCSWGTPASAHRIVGLCAGPVFTSANSYNVRSSQASDGMRGRLEMDSHFAAIGSDYPRCESSMAGHSLMWPTHL
jgi:hypothetical protein